MAEKEVDWIEGITFNRKRGEITISGQRHTVVNSYSFKAYRDAISEIIGHGADAVLYLAGKRHTEEFVKGILKESTLARFAKQFRWGRNKIAEKVADVLTHYGYGYTTVEKVDFEKESIVLLENSCVARNYKKRQKRPVCFYVAGLIAGGANAITGKRYECRETHCIAKGDKVCRFVVKPER
jgi:predicted hydrocarbon binding protein